MIEYSTQTGIPFLTFAQEMGARRSSLLINFATSISQTSRKGLVTLSLEDSHGPIEMHRRSLHSLYDPWSPVISPQQKQMAIAGSHPRRFVLLDNPHCADRATPMPVLELFRFRL